MSEAHRVALYVDRDGQGRDVRREFAAMHRERGGVASFDASVGDFEAALPVSINYNLECDDMVLKHWITNALRRNGISVDEEGDMAGRIIASASDDITLLQGGGRESIHCLSVEELLCRVAKQ